MTPKMYIPSHQKPPKVGDRYVVKKVTKSTDDLWRPSWDVYLEPEEDESEDDDRDLH